MDSAMGVITYGVGTVLGLVLVGTMLVWFVQDITQKKHTILRNYPVIGRLRYLLERQGEYLRQYLVRQRSRRDAVQPSYSRLDVPTRQGRGRHYRIRVHRGHARARLHFVRECPVPSSRRGAHGDSGL